MVFHYTIRGGPCRNGSSHIHLKSEDITCYVGRDKHENEYLIKYGWPGDIWFHVEGLSSAHVYFRLKDVSIVDSIPLDDLPEDSVYDMMQIVKHNSIQGSKLASCKIVWTPHSNLKKTFDMDAGTVTYHNTKLCRYGRCDKDRTRIKELEKTKIERHNVNYFEEMKENERRIIERKKKLRKAQLASETTMYDPVQADLTAAKHRMNRQGDEHSGIDTGLAALEGLALGGGRLHEPVMAKGGDRGDLKSTYSNEDSTDADPIWMKEAENRLEESSESIRFLRARGYATEHILQVLDTSKSQTDALAKLWRQSNSTGDSTERFPQITQLEEGEREEVLAMRHEETEVLRAIFGEDEGAHFAAGDDGTDNCDLFDAVLPITSYEAPERYGLPPPLFLEVYVDNGMAPAYPKEPPILAVSGGGLPEKWLGELTNRLRRKCIESCLEAPGEPQIFALVGYLGEEIVSVIEEESEVLEQQRQKRLQEARAAAEERRRLAAEALRKEQEAMGVTASINKGANYTTEAERRAYAKDVVAATGNQEFPSKAIPTAGKHYNTGVSDQQLIKDLFG